MAKIWEHNASYSFWRHYTDLCTRLSFRRVSIEGREKLPEGAMMLAPNHCAALMDPMLILLLFKGPVGFGSRSDIFTKRTSGILRWLRILPIARERNGIREVAKNHETYKEIVDCLGHDVPFCMFSEGTHRPERGMMPVKKGIFKIAKQAHDNLGKPVWIVPVGIDYEYFFKEMGSVSLRVGDAFEIGEFFSRNEGKSEAEIYRLLCEELQERDLSLLKGEFPHRHDRKFLRAAAAVLTLPFLLACAAGSVLIWLPSEILIAREEDKAWTHTFYYAFRLLLPVFWPFWYVAARMLDFDRRLLKDLFGY